MDICEALLSSSEAGRHPWESARLRIVAALLRAHAPEIFAQTGTILDIGCGDLFVIDELAKMAPGARFIGVDRALGRMVTQNSGALPDSRRIRLYTETSDALHTCEQPVRAVLLLDVIEHIVEDRLWLADIVSQPCFQPKTTFLLTAPAFNFLFSAHDILLGHHRRYELPALLSLLRAAGLEPLEYGYFFFTLFIVRLIQSFCERVSRGNLRLTSAKGLGGWRKNRFWDYTLNRGLDWDYRCGRLLKAGKVVLPGLSVYAVCRKSCFFSPRRKK